MNNLSAGFARVNITPMMGIGIVGYFVPRFAEGVLDDLYVNALALSAGEEKAVLLTLDNCGIGRDVAMDFATSVSEATGIPADAVHAMSTVFFLWILSESMLEKLDRVKVKYGLIE